MKAYEAWTKSEPYYATIVFANNKSEAKKIAFRSDIFDNLWDLNRIDIRVKRKPEYDKEYRGKREMDWDDPQDRLCLCKHGWECDDDTFDPDYCESCAGKDFCGKYEYYLDELKDYKELEDNEAD